jgi:chromosome segregation ATPase
MKTILSSVRSVLAATIFVCVTLSSMGAVAQQTEMSVEQLEAYIKKRKDALEAAISNRDQTNAKVREVQEAMAEQDARREQLQNEVDELCLERDAMEPGSYDDCKAQFGN